MTELRPDDARLVAAIARTRPQGDTDPAAAAAAAVWSCLVEPGDAVAGALVGALGARAALDALLADAWTEDTLTGAEVTGRELRAALGRWRPRLVHEPILFAAQTAAGAGIALVTPQDAVWPPGLADLGPHAPLCLWARGDPTVLARLRPAVAIVGARAATGYGEHLAGEFAAELAGRGIAVVSGAAYGIDGAAHRAALAAGGTTVALLAGGVDRPYPAGHAELLGRIAAAGAVVSEVPCGTAPTRWRFLQRNRTIAALGDATIVVEAGRRSGSLNTAGHAAALGRPLGAVPGPVTSGASAGCHRLLREYDARCVTSADEVAELIGWDAAGGGAPGADDAARTRVADALSMRAARSPEEVARRSGMSVGEVTVQLGLMLLDGLADSDGDGWRRAGAPS